MNVRWMYFLLAGAPASVQAQQADTVVLTGHDLTMEQVVRVARQHAVVRADPKALEQVARSHRLLLLAARARLPIYGLNLGVGLDKDKVIFRAGELDSAVRRLSETFNRNLLLAHSAGVGPDAPEEQVRAAMVTRLNTMLFGATGVQPAVVERYLTFLNRRIHPVVPSRGSIGEADITLLAHVGLAMMGEGQVVFAGVRMDAREALAKAGLKPLVPLAKDGLSIISSNAYAAGLSALVARDAERLLQAGELITALSLEGLNGNVAPLVEPVQQVRPFPAQNQAADRMRGYLEGSFLWDADSMRALQDPLSFRTASQVYGTARDNLDNLKRLLLVQLNSSDDNPVVVLDVKPPEGAPPVTRMNYVSEGDLSGALLPSANFEPVSWVVGLEALGAALRHVSNGGVQRMTRLGADDLTGLTRFLAPDPRATGFAMVQYSYVALDAEVRALSNPVSADAAPVAGGIEDVASNGLLVAERIGRMVDDLYYLLGMELMHAAQAVDLRKRAVPRLRLGRETGVLYTAYRREVAFLDRDRILTDDIEKSYRFLKSTDLPRPGR